MLLVWVYWQREYTSWYIRKWSVLVNRVKWEHSLKTVYYIRSSYILIRWWPWPWEQPWWHWHWVSVSTWYPDIRAQGTSMQEQFKQIQLQQLGFEYPHNLWLNYSYFSFELYSQTNKIPSIGLHHCPKATTKVTLATNNLMRVISHHLRTLWRHVCVRWQAWTILSASKLKNFGSYFVCSA